MNLFQRVALAAALFCALSPAALAQPGPTHNGFGQSAYDNTADALRIYCTDASGAYTGCSGGVGGSGTEYTEDAALPANPLGGAIICRRKDTLSGSEVSADGDAIAFNCTSKGEHYTHDTDALAQLVLIATAAGDTTTEQPVKQATAANLNAQVVGDVAHDGVDAGKPVKIGCLAKSSAPTAVADADRSNALCDLLGKLVVQPYALGASLVSGLTTAMTGTTSTAVTGVGAPGAGLYNNITTLVCGNSHATVGTFVELQDGSGGTTFFTIPAAAVYGGSAMNFPAPLRQPTANTPLYAKNTTTGANVICSVAGFKGP